MTKKESIEHFFTHRQIALVGLSRNRRKFSHVVYRHLVQHGYRVLPINPNTEAGSGVQCYKDFHELPERVSAALIMVSPSETAKVVRQAVDYGISAVWIQQGAESAEALRICEESGLVAVSGACILMFAEPVGFLHRLHRGILRLCGKLPK